MFWTLGFIASVLEALTPGANLGDCIILFLVDAGVFLNIVQLVTYHHRKKADSASSLLPK